MSAEERFYNAYPDAFFLNLEKVEDLENYLKERGWLKANEFIKTVGKAGEGNMNLTLRVRTTHGSFIIKQARPWVEKYPDVPAPAERALMEARFYQLIQTHKTLASLTPVIADLDDASFIMMMEDLGKASDLSDLYERDIYIDKSDLKSLVDFMAMLHGSFNSTTVKQKITNKAMRQLNHRHLFIYPFEKKNGLDLDSVQQGLQEVSWEYKNDESLKATVKELGTIYLSEGDTLLHGDYYPGSWLKTKNGIKIIDPEFCFFGPAEFDLGVFIAHIKLAQQPKAVMDEIFRNYTGFSTLNKPLLSAFAGIEIMRRIIGLAQLPLALSLDAKKQLLREAYVLIMG